jgi:hypothetical protein
MPKTMLAVDLSHYLSGFTHNLKPHATFSEVD